MKSECIALSCVLNEPLPCVVFIKALHLLCTPRIKPPTRKFPAPQLVSLAGGQEVGVAIVTLCRHANNVVTRVIRA